MKVWVILEHGFENTTVVGVLREQYSRETVEEWALEKAGPKSRIVEELDGERWLERKLKGHGTVPWTITEHEVS